MLLATCELIPYFKPLILPVCLGLRLRSRPVPARHGTPAGPNADRDGRLRLGTTLGRPHEQIRLGDVIWFSPGEKHRHGTTAITAMTYIAIVEQMEKVSDEQYQSGLRAE